jgi:ABC-type Fe3+ transport system permease subunit
MRPPAEREAGDPELLQELRKFSDSDVTAKAKAVNPYSEEDDNNHKRITKSEERETLAKITKWFYWFLFCLVCIIVFVLTALVLFVIGYYVSSLIFGTKISDSKTLVEVITKIFQGVLIAMATLFLERVLKKRNE